MGRNQRAGLAFIFVAVIIDTLGAGLIIPVLPRLINSFEGVDLSLASSFYGFLIAVYALLSFVFASAVGSLSDRFGRRPVLLLSLLGLGLDYVIIALAPNLAWLVVGRVFVGIFGAIETTAMAYIADISEPEERARNFGLIGAAFGLGFIVEPLLGGVLGVSTYDYLSGARLASRSSTCSTACLSCRSRSHPNTAGRLVGRGRTRSTRSSRSAAFPTFWRLSASTP